MAETRVPAFVSGVSGASGFVPPRIVPPAAPLPLWRFLPTFVSNPLRTIPEPVYHEPIYVPAPLKGRVAWVTAPELVERILLKEQDKFRKTDTERRVFEPMIGGGILTAMGNDWRWQRRTLAPMFRPGDLMNLVPQMRQAAEQLVARWQAHGDGVRRIDEDMTDVTFDVLTSTIFSGATTTEQHALKTETGRYLDGTSWEIAYEILGVRHGFWHPKRRSMRSAARALHDAVQGMVARERGNGWKSGGLGARLGQARDPETGEGMPDGVIVANLATFAAAGHETTAKALTWALYLLARAPEWQARIRAEVATVTGGRAIEAGDVEKLVVTRQVFEEAMRLYPPAPVMTRQVVEPIELGGVTFQKDAMIVIPIFVIHRHRALWQRPDDFDPDRFHPDRTKGHARTQFMPFGFGPRICIGMAFAMIEGVVLLATMVRDTNFSAGENVAPEPVSRVTLKPRGGMPLTVTTSK